MATVEKQRTTRRARTSPNFDVRFTRFLVSTDSIVYALVGGSFLVAALLSLIYGIVKFAYTIYGISELHLSTIFSVTGDKAGAALINFVSDLLLTLIIMEVMGTIVHYLQTRATSLKPFLFIGIISATRGVLAVGARLSVTNFQTLSVDEFNHSMIELGVNAGVIIALALALRLVGHFLEDDSQVQVSPPDKELDGADA